MGVKKLKDLFSTRKPQRPAKHKLHEVKRKLDLKDQDSSEVLRENQKTKVEIQRLKDSIHKKLKDPKAAQKAAAILTDYLNKK